MCKKIVAKDLDELRIILRDPNVSLKNVDISNLTSLDCLFYESERTNEQFEGIEDWDVSHIKSFMGTFAYAKHLNRDISKWDVSNGEVFSGMLMGAESINQPIGKWNMKNAKRLKKMLLGTTSLDQDISSWNVENVEDIQEICYKSAISYPINNMNWRSVENYRSAFSNNQIENLFAKCQEHIKDNQEYFNGYELSMDKNHFNVNQIILTDNTEETNKFVKENPESEFDYIKAFHINAESSIKNSVDRLLRDAVMNLKKRRLLIEARALDKKERLLSIKEKSKNVIVYLKDSYAAGNCVSGTKDFCEKYNLDTTKGVEGSVLYKLAMKDPQQNLILNAIEEAILRNELGGN